MVRRVLLPFAVVFCLCGCGAVEVRVERYAPPVWETDWIMRIKIAPMVGFNEPYRGLAADLAGKIGIFLKETDAYISVELLPLTSFALRRGENGEALLKPDEVKKLGEGADAILSVQVLSFRSKVELSRTHIGFGMGHGTPEWTVMGAFSLRDRWFAEAATTTAFILYRSSNGAIERRLICRKRIQTPPLPGIPDESQIIATLFDTVKNEILCRLHIRRSVVTRILIDSTIPAVSHGVDAVLCGDIKEAEKAFADAVRNNDDSVEAHYNYAVVLEVLHKYEDALEHYKTAQVLAGGDAFESEVEDVRTTLEALEVYEKRQEKVKRLLDESKKREVEPQKEEVEEKPKKSEAGKKQS